MRPSFPIQLGMTSLLSSGNLKLGTVHILGAALAISLALYVRRVMPWYKLSLYVLRFCGGLVDSAPRLQSEVTGSVFVSGTDLVIKPRLSLIEGAPYQPSCNHAV